MITGSRGLACGGLCSGRSSARSAPDEAAPAPVVRRADFDTSDHDLVIGGRLARGVQADAITGPVTAQCVGAVQDAVRTAQDLDAVDPGDRQATEIEGPTDIVGRHPVD